MDYHALAIPDVVLLTPKVFGDERGFFMETFRHDEFIKHCGNFQFVQDNHSSSGKSILRGLHYQLKQPQGKLVRVSRGEVFDVAVDMRKNSPTYGKWVGEYLSETNNRMMWVPPGFAHGFLVTSELAEFQYKCTDYYAPHDECALLWNDPALAIDWPLAGGPPVLSAKDQAARCFSDSPYYG
jgi:dTDP-4-dehydrorhamnose 3,5-epimerase